MKYKALLSCGNDLIEREIENVELLDVAEDVYYMRDKNDIVVFTAPFVSVVYIEKLD